MYTPTCYTKHLWMQVLLELMGSFRWGSEAIT